MMWRVAQLAGVAGPAPTDAVMLACALALFSVAVGRHAYHVPPRRDGRRERRVLILGSDAVADRMRVQLTAMTKVHVVGFVDDDPKDESGWLGPLQDLASVCDREQVEHVVVAFSETRPADHRGPPHGPSPPSDHGGAPTLRDRAHDGERSGTRRWLPRHQRPVPIFGRWPTAAKRCTDIAGAGLALLVLSPVLIAVAIGVRLTSAGPMILRQERVGRGGQVFSMLKFRTMVVHAVDAHPAKLEGESTNGPFPKLKDDPRVTPFGRLLRRASIDELPQLWNVLVGQMSLVGPRPFVLDDAAVIGGWALRRYAVRPGITGLWQVSGRNDLTYDEMCRLDHLYVSCWSLGLDLRVLLRTLRAVTGAHGAY